MANQSIRPAPTVLLKPVVDTSPGFDNILSPKGKPVAQSSVGTSFLELQEAFGLVGPKLIASWKEDQDKLVFAKTANENYEELRKRLAKEEREYQKKNLYPTGGGAYRRFRELEILGDKSMEEARRELITSIPKFTVRDPDDPELWSQDLFNRKAPASPIARRRAANLWGDIQSDFLRRVDIEKARQDDIRGRNDFRKSIFDLLHDYADPYHTPLHRPEGSHPWTEQGAVKWANRNLPDMFSRGKDGKRLVAGADYYKGALVPLPTPPSSIMTPDDYWKLTATGVDSRDIPKPKKSVKDRIGDAGISTRGVTEDTKLDRWTEAKSQAEDASAGKIFDLLQRLRSLSDSFQESSGSSGVDETREVYANFTILKAKEIELIAKEDPEEAEELLSELENTVAILDGVLTAPWTPKQTGVPPDIYDSSSQQADIALQRAWNAIEQGDSTEEDRTTKNLRLNSYIDGIALTHSENNPHSLITASIIIDALKAAKVSDKDFGYMMGNGMIRDRVDTWNNRITELSPELEAAAAAVIQKSGGKTQEQIEKEVESALSQAIGQSLADGNPEYIDRVMVGLKSQISRVGTQEENFTEYITTQNKGVYLTQQGFDRYFKTTHDSMLNIIGDSESYKELGLSLRNDMESYLREELMRIWRDGFAEDGTFDSGKTSEKISAFFDGFLVDSRALMKVSETDQTLTWDEELADKILSNDTRTLIESYQRSLKGGADLTNRGSTSDFTPYDVRKPGTDGVPRMLPEEMDFTGTPNPLTLSGFTSIFTLPLHDIGLINKPYLRARHWDQFDLPYAIERSQDITTGLIDGTLLSPERVIDAGLKLKNTANTQVASWMSGINIKRTAGEPFTPKIIHFGYEPYITDKSQDASDNQYRLRQLGRTPLFYLSTAGGLVPLSKGNSGALIAKMIKSTHEKQPGKTMGDIDYNQHGVVPDDSEVKEIMRSGLLGSVQTELHTLAYRVAGHNDPSIFIDGHTSNGILIADKPSFTRPLHFIYGDPTKMYDALVDLANDTDVDINDYSAILRIGGGKYQADTSKVKTSGEVTGNNELIVAFERYKRALTITDGGAGVSFKTFAYLQLTGLATRTGVYIKAVGAPFKTLESRSYTEKGEKE